MTIAVCCTLADGVVLGTDSAITVTGGTQTPQGVLQGILKVYFEADKVFGFHLDAQKDQRLPAGLVTFGLATLGSRTIHSFVREFELDREPKVLKKLTMGELSEALHKFFREKYHKHLSEVLAGQQKTIDDIPVAQRVLGMFVGGFSPEEPLPEAWEVNVHLEAKDGGVKQVRKPGDFGSNWGGQFAGVSRFHKGFDPQLLDALMTRIALEYKIVDPNNKAQVEHINRIVQETVAPFEYQVPFAAMPLQEGIDYTTFLLDMAILQHRFVIGAPTCGGNVRLALVRKHEGFQWVAGQTFEVKGARHA